MKPPPLMKYTLAEPSAIDMTVALPFWTPQSIKTPQGSVGASGSGIDRGRVPFNIMLRRRGYISFGSDTFFCSGLSVIGIDLTSQTHLHRLATTDHTSGRTARGRECEDGHKTKTHQADWDQDRQG